MAGFKAEAHHNDNSSFIQLSHNLWLNKFHTELFCPSNIELDVSKIYANNKILSIDCVQTAKRDKHRHNYGGDKLCKLSTLTRLSRILEPPMGFVH